NAVQRPVDCSGRVEDAERSSDDEQEEDDLGSVGHSRQNGGEEVEGVRRCRIPGVIGAADDELAARIVEFGVVLSRRDEVGGDSQEDDDSEEYDERVWDALRLGSAGGLLSGSGFHVHIAPTTSSAFGSDPWPPDRIPALPAAIAVVQASSVLRQPCISDQSWQAGCPDRKSTRLNSSHVSISYAVFCLKNKKTVENGVDY